MARTSDGADFHEEWQEFLQENVLLQPVMAPDGKRIGTLLLVRELVWQDAEMLLLDQMADALGHAWNALSPQKKRSGFLISNKRRRIVIGALVAAILIVMFLPVRQSIIAPATVQPRDPIMIAAPIGGVLFAMSPFGQMRRWLKGILLFSFEDAELRANYEIALRAVDTAEANCAGHRSRPLVIPRGALK
ncbi:MAG: hypothetical protein ACFHHU_18810 [Porticoccaceae bacterium]